MKSTNEPQRPPIFALVGPKHVGKSTVGRLLASRMNAAFRDLDDCIHEDSGKSPRELYLQGAAHFRTQEAASLIKLLENPGSTPLVLATGGGIVDNLPAWEALLGACTLILLDLDAKGAFERILETSRDKGMPSFLRTANPEETHRSLHESRMARYRSAALIQLQVAGRSPADNAQTAYHLLCEANLLDHED